MIGYEMSETTGSGWDDLQYPYGLLNIKGGEMPSYPNFVRGNLDRGSNGSYASLNMTSEITPFFNSRLEVINVNKFIEDGGVTVLEPEKTYVIKMPKLVKKCKSNSPYGIRTVRYGSCDWENPFEVVYEYTYFIRPLNKAKMTLNLELYDKNNLITPWNLGDDGLNIFTVVRFGSFSSGNDLNTIMSADSQMYCHPKMALKLQNIRKRDCLTEIAKFAGGTSFSGYSNIADIFLQLEFYPGGGITTKTLYFAAPPLKMFTEGVTLQFSNDLSGPASYEFKLLVGSRDSMVTTNTTTLGVKNKTRLPHTLTMLARDSEKENLPKIGLTGNPIQMLFNSMFKFSEDVIIIPLLNITY